MKAFISSIGVMALIVAITGIVFVSTGTVVEAGDCAKEPKTVAQSLQGSGANGDCWYIDDDGDRHSTTCYEHYWVFPVHQSCVDSDNEGFCCRIVSMEAKYHEGTCNSEGGCTIGDEVVPEDENIVVPTYFSATFLACDADGGANKECGSFEEE